MPENPPSLSISLRDGVSANPEYVAWMDIMGLQNVMLRSLDTSSIFILKLHQAAKMFDDTHDITLYPTMDGLFITSDNKDEMKSFLQDTLSTLSKDAASQQNKFKYLVRTGVAYGPVVHAKDISDDAAEDLSTDYLSSLVFGIPVIQAFRAEGNAPPYGVNIDESARAFAPEEEEPFNYKWWKWFYVNGEDYDHKDLFNQLSESLEDYFKWCVSNSERIGYDKNNIEEHYSLLRQYSSKDLEDL